ncbi:cupin domain-containing protein [Arthrobacter sp. NEB 688]|uniref:cupin domain-containing protein n=1 Tax=Arthrobacter sp. NEB 688 TaxID=904039 RepID=UPI0015648D0F|nr:cupin domain-containing protein [Arthrobacter sp. NEB 688]QKE83048.1 cupin domain-containing protein [Arthrobacter sp. NEB 688]
MGYPPRLYDGDDGEVSAWSDTADRPPDLTYPNGNRVHYLASAASTGGLFGLYCWTFAGPPSGPGPHFHRTLSESFHVLEGVVRIFDGRDWLRAGAGDFVHVPPGGVHGFRNEDGPARMLLHFAPGAPREGYFEGLAAGTDGWNRERYDAFMAEHDNIWVDGS